MLICYCLKKCVFVFSLGWESHPKFSMTELEGIKGAQQGWVGQRSLVDVDSLLADAQGLQEAALLGRRRLCLGGRSRRWLGSLGRWR